MHRVSSRVYRETAFTNIIFSYNRLDYCVTTFLMEICFCKINIPVGT